MNCNPKDYRLLADHPGDGYVCVVLFENLAQSTNRNAAFLPQLAYRAGRAWKLRVLEGSGDFPSSWRPVGWLPF